MYVHVQGQVQMLVQVQGGVTSPCGHKTHLRRAGIRPLARDPGATDTASVSRDHVIFTSPSGLVTISGGKWTTMRKMAEDVVDVAVRNAGLQASSCRTENV